MHGRNRNRRRYRSRTYIVVLFGLSITAMLLPASWTSGLIGLVQILVPFQHAAGGALDAITPSSSLDNTPVPAERHRAVTLERDALQHQVAALTLQIARLGREVEGLTRSRMWNALGNPLGAAGRLIPAGVITDDLLPWRDSRLINAGSLRGVQRGDAVTSSCFPVDVGQAEGVRSGLAIVLQEVLVGTVEQVTTHTARVRLLSDPDVGRKVRLVRAAEDGMQPFDGAFWLRGRGHGVMAIHDVNRRDVADGLI
ncbi:MAG: rod shape-determining protein MreC, partial [Phycisphaerae bacterium]